MEHSKIASAREAVREQERRLQHSDGSAQERLRQQLVAERRRYSTLQGQLDAHRARAQQQLGQQRETFAQSIGSLRAEVESERSRHEQTRTALVSEQRRHAETEAARRKAQDALVAVQCAHAQNAPEAQFHHPAAALAGAVSQPAGDPGTEKENCLDAAEPACRKRKHPSGAQPLQQQQRGAVGARGRGGGAEAVDNGIGSSGGGGACRVFNHVRLQASSPVPVAGLRARADSFGQSILGTPFRDNVRSLQTSLQRCSENAAAAAASSFSSQSSTAVEGSPEQADMKDVDEVPQQLHHPIADVSGECSIPDADIQVDGAADNARERAEHHSTQSSTAAAVSTACNTTLATVTTTPEGIDQQHSMMQQPDETTRQAHRDSALQESDQHVPITGEAREQQEQLEEDEHQDVGVVEHQDVGVVEHQDQEVELPPPQAQPPPPQQQEPEQEQEQEGDRTQGGGGGGGGGGGNPQQQPPSQEQPQQEQDARACRRRTTRRINPPPRWADDPSTQVVHPPCWIHTSPSYIHKQACS
jgi:uncharacterized membrane protein YgcG